MDVKPSYGLGEEEIERMLEEAIDEGEHDLEQRLLITARNDAEQILVALRKHLGEHAELAEPDERLKMEELAGRLEAARAGADRELVVSLVQELNDLSTPFAQRIMESAIKQVLERKSVDELS